MKKLLSLLLVLAMILSVSAVMCACGEGENKTSQTEQTKETEETKEKKEDTIVGEWKGEADFTDYFSEMMAESLGEEMAGYFTMDDVTMNVVLSFDEDGEFEMTFDAEDLVDALGDALVDGLTVLFEEMIEENGLDYTVDELIGEAYNMSLEELVDEFIATWDVDELVQSRSAEYEIDGNKLYIGDDGAYFKFELDGDELQLKKYSETSDDEEVKLMMEKLCDIVFERD